MKEMRAKLFSLFFFVSVFVFFLHPFDGNADFYHHVNTGRFIIEHKGLPYFDVFSHTAKGMPWIAHSWGSGLIFYLILTYVGELGISLFISALAVLTFALLYKLLRSYRVSSVISFLSLGLAAPLIAQRFPQRPETLSYPLAASFLLIDKLKSDNQKLSLLLPLLTLIWVNFYGSGSILALLLIGLFLVKQFIQDGFKIEGKRRIFYLSSLACFPLSLLNGYGLNSLFYFYLYIPKVAKYEGEWSGIIDIFKYFPLNFLITYQYQILTFFVFLVLFLIVISVSVKKILSDKFLLILSPAVFVPFFALRQIPLATIFSIPAFAKMLDLQSGLKKKILVALTFLVAVFLILLNIWTNTPKLTQEPDLSRKNFNEFIKKNDLSGKAFNHTHMGSSITYYFYPKILVFYDTRDEVYLETEALKDLYQLFSSGTTILPILNKYNIDLVLGDLVNDNMNYKELFYSKDWAIVFLDDRYFTAVPRKVAIQKQLKILDFLDPYSPYGVKSGLEEEAVKYYGTLNPKSFNNQFLLANSLIFLGRYSEAQKILQQLPISQGPYQTMFNKDLDYLLAYVYLKQNNCSEAKTYLDQVQKEINGVLIFDPGKTLPSSVNKGYALYYLSCGKDSETAQRYLNLYLSQKDITPLEKVKTQMEFDKSKQDYR